MIFSEISCVRPFEVLIKQKRFYLLLSFAIREEIDQIYYSACFGLDFVSSKFLIGESVGRAWTLKRSRSLIYRRSKFPICFLLERDGTHQSSGTKLYTN